MQFPLGNLLKLKLKLRVTVGGDMESYGIPVTVRGTVSYIKKLLPNFPYPRQQLD